MKKILLYATITSLLLTSSCSKDFLIETPTDVISSEDLANAVGMDPSLLAGNISGLYTLTFTTESGGTTGHDDFGQKGYDIFLDMICSDMVLGGVNYGWYSGIARYTTTIDFTSNNVYIPWRYYYRLIFSANGIIDALGGENAELEGESKYYMGQAKAIRAHSYFYLANLYSREGFGTGNELILPIYRSAAQPNQPLSSASEVYDLIVEDLESSISLLEGFQRTSKDQIDVNVAKGILAYALAARGTNADLQKAATLTSDVMAVYPLTSREQVVAQFNGNGQITNSGTAGFNNVNTSSWLWGIDLTEDIGLNLVSWWGQIDMYTYSYAWAGDPKRIDKALYDKIPSNDIRKAQFDPTSLVPSNKFFDPARVMGGQRYITTDYLYLRSDEMALLNAEVNARLGNEGTAKQSLIKLLDLRLDNTSYINGLSGSALLDEIYLQSRIELWGEGKSYLAMKRNKRTITRGSNHLFHAGQSFNYNAQELSFPIPQAEVINNPQL